MLSLSAGRIWLRKNDNLYGIRNLLVFLSGAKERCFKCILSITDIMDIMIVQVTKVTMGITVWISN
jgi:hypothetical protein